jgi:heptosyltransferase-3
VPLARWRPWAVPTVVLGDQGIDCAGCRTRTCPRAGHPCVGSVPLAAVLSAVETLTGDDRTPRSSVVAPRACQPAVAT